MASKASQRSGSNGRRRKVARATNSANQGWSKLATVNNQVRQSTMNQDKLSHKQVDAVRHASRQDKQYESSLAPQWEEGEQVRKDAGSSSSTDTNTTPPYFLTSSSSGLQSSAECLEEDDLLLFEDPHFGQESVDNADYWDYVFADGPEPRPPLLSLLQSWWF